MTCKTQDSARFQSIPTQQLEADQIVVKPTSLANRDSGFFRNARTCHEMTRECDSEKPWEDALSSVDIETNARYMPQAGRALFSFRAFGSSLIRVSPMLIQFAFSLIFH